MKFGKYVMFVLAFSLCGCGSSTSFDAMKFEDTTIRTNTCLHEENASKPNQYSCLLSKRDMNHYVDIYTELDDQKLLTLALNAVDADKEMVETLTAKLKNLKETDGLATDTDHMLFRLENDEYWVFFYKDYLFIKQGDLKQAYEYPEDLKELVFDYYTNTMHYDLDAIPNYN